jgi:threonyl-tRNA synthetase
VRRFQQDDAHIFCRPDQIKDEVKGALQFLIYVYSVFGFEFTIALSTRPKKAIGEKSVWDKAEQALKEALNEAGADWTLNPGDGAFYGPKIDIRLRDAMQRRHQCGTIQLDFQLPIRFNLQYKTEGAEDDEDGGAAEEAKAKNAAKEQKKAAKAAIDDVAVKAVGEKIRVLKEKLKGEGLTGKALNENAEVVALVNELQALRGESAGKDDKKKPAKDAPKAEETPKAEEAPKDEPKSADGKKPEYVWKEQAVKPGFERPVMIHRAILGSVERCVAILTEHFGGKWPFWLSPRQIMVIPVAGTFNAYAKYVTDTLCSFGFYAEMDAGSNTLPKKIRNAQIAQWNYQAIVGEKEEETLSVNLRSRDLKDAIGTFTIPEMMDKLKAEGEPSSKKFNEYTAWKGQLPQGSAQAASSAAAPSAKASANNGGGSSAKPAKGGAAATAGASSKAGAEEAHLELHPYLGGYAPSKKDAQHFSSLKDLPKTPNLARWFEHMTSFTAMERESWS